MITLLNEDSVPVCLHILGQPLANNLYKEGRVLRKRLKDIKTVLHDVLNDDEYAEDSPAKILASDLLTHIDDLGI